MRAVVYKAPFQVAIENVADPKIQHPNDVLVRITTSAICGSDLHMYEGRTAAQPGIVFGHENMGIVEEVGSGVVSIKKGDRVSMPFNVACGFCKNCLAGYTGFCLTVNPGFAGGAYGYVAMGPYTGGQAEWLRVPFADFNCLPLPQGDEHEADFALLADIFPTGYHGCELAQVSPGETGERASATAMAGKVTRLRMRRCLRSKTRMWTSTAAQMRWTAMPQPGSSWATKAAKPRAARAGESHFSSQVRPYLSPCQGSAVGASCSLLAAAARAAATSCS